jgi:hypothetical protein
VNSFLFDPAAEAERFTARREFLARQEALRLELAPGVTFQPETAESVEDQIRETLLAEGLQPVPGSADYQEAARSFAALAPRREFGRISLAATLFLGFPAAERDAKLWALEGFPETLALELSDGQRILPAVDRGSAKPGERLPAVLALRWSIPPGLAIVGLVTDYPIACAHYAAPPSWSRWAQID